jgi:hypothetical protein
MATRTPPAIPANALMPAAPQASYIAPPEFDAEPGSDIVYTLVQEVIRRADAKQQFFEDAAALGELLTSKIDNSRYFLGAIANCIDREYGEKNLQEFAARAAVAESTIRQYCAHVAYYGLDTCLMFTRQNIKYSHQRTAKALGDPEQSIALLQRAADELWTTKQLAEAVYNGRTLELTDEATTPSESERKLIDLHHAPIQHIDVVRGTVTFSVGTDAAADLTGTRNAHLIVKVPRETQSVTPVTDSPARLRVSPDGEVLG